MGLSASEVLGKLLDILKEREYAIKPHSKGFFEASKKLPRVGVKRREIYFLIKPMKIFGVEEAKELNSVFNKKKPTSMATFYFYNLVAISEGGYTDEAMDYSRKKMFDSWNLRPILPWDVFFTSFTKITHLVSIKDRKVLYPFDFESLRKFMHKEVIEIFTELITGLD